MATAYCFNLPYHGHIHPCVPLLAELSRKGEKVIFYGTEQFRHIVERAGAIFRLFEYEETLKGVALMVMAEWQMQVTQSCLNRLIADAEEDEPAYVIADYACLWGRHLAHYLGVPAVIVHSTFPTHFSYMMAARITLREFKKSALIRRTFFAFLRADRRIAKKWGVPRVGVPFNLLCPRNGQLHLVMSSREMSSQVQASDTRYVFVGPCVRAIGYTQGEPLPAPDDRPLVYVSLGTFWNDRPAFYRACIEAYADAPFQVLISLGHGIQPETLGTVPTNVHLRQYVDQMEVLDRASAFLTHGGMNSICEALLAGVPMLVFPQAVDQFSLAHYVENRGAGVVLKPADITPSSLREATLRVLGDPGIRASSQQVGQRLRKNPGSAHAADLIMKLRMDSPRRFGDAQTDGEISDRGGTNVRQELLVRSRVE